MKLKNLAFLVYGMYFTHAFEGDGTYYGEGGAGASGACMLPRFFNGIYKTVAINQAQWDGGLTCGKCVQIHGEGQGLGTKPIIGPIFATIDNLCPECKFGDIDMGLEGDGRFLIHWDFIPCDQVPHAHRKKLRGA